MGPPGTAREKAKVAVVTGAAGGIGAGICRRLAADGFALACVDLRADDVAGLAGELPNARGYGADVGDAGAVRAHAAAITADLGAPWLLVNAARVFSIQLLPDLEESEWDRIIDTNLKGPYLTCREFMPAMISAGDGCVINIASTAGVRGGRRRAAYCTSKHSKCVLRTSVRLIDTEMADWIRHDEQAMTEFAARTPAGRIGQPADIADAVAFLASDQASYLHGAVMMVDGGGTA